MRASIRKTNLELVDGKEYINVQLEIKIRKKDYIKMLNSSSMGEVEINGRWR